MLARVFEQRTCQRHAHFDQVVGLHSLSVISSTTPAGGGTRPLGRSGNRRTRGEQVSNTLGRFSITLVALAL